LLWERKEYLRFMKQHYAQHAKMTVKPGKLDDVIQRLRESIEVLECTPGCSYYLISTTEEQDVVWISELWASKKAKDSLTTSPETAKIMKELMPLVVSVTDQTVMTVVGGFGIQ
jgi:quinol monooxygenase YgiN